MRDILSYLRPYRTKLIASVVFALLFALLSSFSLSLISPLLQSLFYDKPLSAEGDILTRFTGWMLTGSRLDAIIRLQVVLISVFLLKGVFGYLHRYLAVATEEGVIKDTRKKIVEHIYSLSLDYFHKTSSGTWVSRITNDIGRIERSVYDGLLGITRHILLIGAFFLLALYLSWQLLAVTIIIFPLITKLVNFLGKRLREHSETVQENIGDVTSLFSEALAGIKIIKAYGTKKREMGKIIHSSKRYFKSRLRFERVGLIGSPLSEVLVAIGICAVISYGVYQVFHQQITPDRFIVFLTCVIAMMDPLRRIPQANVHLQQGVQAMKRIQRVLSMMPTVVEDKDPVKLPEFKESVVFKKVSFSYNSGEVVIRDLNLTIKKGESIALVGPSGAGKSTIADLLLRFYDPTSGHIEIDGIDLRRISIKNLRKRIGLVTQEPFLFNDTIGNNITYGEDENTQERIRLCAQMANIDQFIEGLPDGYETIVGERGITLSGGERQRIAIARALYSDPDMLIFDEATSHLDQISEKKVQDAIHKVLLCRTALVIAHRLSTVKDCTKIVVIDQGIIVEEGTHEKLMERDGLYRRLVERGLE
ncbi:ABC transporter ATP-binding protein/permease [candidate division WOR-3 bacterium]|nr:ABC transporter ATP-binding protein/permease [candidate division WOR-3 bacterium]